MKGILKLAVVVIAVQIFLIVAAAVALGMEEARPYYEICDVMIRNGVWAAFSTALITIVLGLISACKRISNLEPSAPIQIARPPFRK